MKKFAIVTRLDEKSRVIEKQIVQRLEAEGFVMDTEAPDYCFVVGGDGTFLYAVNQYLSRLDCISFFGIHTGTLGFMTDYVDNELDDFINDFLKKEHKFVEYQLLEITVDNQKKYYALNEMRIENIHRTQSINVCVNGLEFESYRGTGLCISTQLGSTAYNRSVGGSVIQEGLPIIQMSEIAGIHNKSYHSLGASIVMKEDAIITLHSDNYNGARLCYDAQNTSLDGVHAIRVALGPHKVKMIRLKNINYFKRLSDLF